MILSKHNIDNTSREDLEKFFRELKKQPCGNYEVYICSEKPSRSAAQRRYYFSCIVKILSDHCGFSKWEMNEQIKDHFNPKNIKDINGRWKTVGGSIETESRAKCEQIFDHIRTWALGTLDVVIPLPEKIPNDYYIDVIQDEK